MPANRVALRPAIRNPPWRCWTVLADRMDSPHKVVNRLLTPPVSVTAAETRTASRPKWTSASHGQRSTKRSSASGIRLLPKAMATRTKNASTGIAPGTRTSTATASASSTADTTSRKAVCRQALPQRRGGHPASLLISPKIGMPSR